MSESESHIDNHVPSFRQLIESEEYRNIPKGDFMEIRNIQQLCQFAEIINIQFNDKGEPIDINTKEKLRGDTMENRLKSYKLKVQKLEKEEKYEELASYLKIGSSTQKLQKKFDAETNAILNAKTDADLKNIVGKK